MKKRAIEIIQNLTSTIDKMEDKKNIISLAREDMFSAPTVSQSRLKESRDFLIAKYNLKEKEWSK